jgi:hypothetical protein
MFTIIDGAAGEIYGVVFAGMAINSTLSFSEAKINSTYSPCKSSIIMLTNGNCFALLETKST